MAEDPVAAFLANEKAELGDITDELYNGAGTGSDVGSTGNLGEDDFSEIEAPEVPNIPEVVTSEAVHSVTTNSNNFNSLNGTQSRKSSTMSVPAKQESPILESWRANFDADIKSRDEREEKRLAELEANAKKELETWYAHYRQQQATKLADNRAEAPKDLSGKAYSGYSGPTPSVGDTAVWESVCGMCDLHVSVLHNHVSPLSRHYSHVFFSP
ncbi:unnamed protein product [Mesocestoides corti]|uniref:Clathrin light chain n=1 Tax=Mesocestoides corti TaxID=53468 RepID=A0A0R3U5A7_MESCO|nr:unnamed protein product [Mesocestoides corti]